MESPKSATGRRKLRASGLEAARKKSTPYDTKKAKRTFETKWKALKFYQSMRYA
jgi:hypothetical protein